MRLTLPPDTVDLADAVRQQASAASGEPPAVQYGALDRLGVLDLLGPDGPDPENCHLDAVVCLEQLAGAGLCGPFAETMWWRAAPHEDPKVIDETREGLVALPSRIASGQGRLVPYGAQARSIGLAGPHGLAVAARDGATPVAVIVSEGHLWVPVPEGTKAFDEAAPDFAWRASAALTLGYLEAGLSMATSHARARHQFGRSLDSFQAIAFRLAESRWRLSGLRLIIHEAGWRADRGHRQALPVSTLAWVYARRAGRVVAAHLHQIHGAIGFSGELGLTRLSGACALLRTTVGPQPAVQAAWAERSDLTSEPPSTVFAGFRV